MTLLTGLMLSASVAAQPIMIDDFSSGDVSKTMNGFKWSGSDSANDLSSVTHVAETETRKGELGHGLHFRYKAGSSWTEKRFDLGNPHREVWVRYWIRVPDNFKHGSGNPNNNKFFALWMDGYSSKGDGPTVFWNYWRSDNGAELTVSYSHGQKTVSGPNAQRTDFIDDSADRGRWMEVVLRVKAATDRNSNDGIIETHRRWEGEGSFTKIHEIKDANIAAPPGGPNGWHSGYIMGYANATYSEDTIWVIDEIEFSNSSLLQSAARPRPPIPQ
ncbi:hypothetical protein [Marinimicrobium sp. ABcell2]|uniref:hypothetical protein n=1 Tax=Marinimicrobium sp. ABcell2 TaxID=3069751 RepID=UPI0027B122E3|nr:hypothetical protein [Marinimicrobium sp. ABcell2]MDQ2076173.1 hypothetical protein [Marinimicrobium sp. ABcell2]